MSFEVSFPGGVAVDATFRGNTVRTDQPPPLGGGTAMSPFDLFLASIVTCMGFYALRFCQERELATEGMGFTLTPRRDETKRLATIEIDMRLPQGFPEKYRDAIVRAVDQCAVKKVMLDPPEFAIHVR
jgi:putative redox protein